jgi:hypothetical protein
MHGPLAHSSEPSRCVNVVLADGIPNWDARHEEQKRLLALARHCAGATVVTAVDDSRVLNQR